MTKTKTKLHGDTSLSKTISDEAKKERSYFKKIFDEVESRSKLEQAIIMAHAELIGSGHNDPLKKLLSYSKHYFEPVLYNYPNNDIYGLKKATEHTIEILTKWAGKINDAVESNSPISGFNRYIHRSVAALASKLNNIEDIEIRRRHFQIASYKINETFFEYSGIIQDVIRKSIENISNENDLNNIIVEVGDGSIKSPQSTGVSLPLEIKHITEIIKTIYSHFDEKNKKLDGIYIAQISRAISSLKTRLCSIEKLNTRYNYITKTRSAINGSIKDYDKSFIEIIKQSISELKDEESTQYKSNKYSANIISTTSEKQKAICNIRIEDAKEIFLDVESEMVKQMQPARYQSWSKLCLAICLLSGRRIYEVCVTGNFEVLESHKMRITGIAKQKTDDNKNNKSIDFTTFANANLIMQAIETLRNIKDFDVYNNDYRRFDKATGTSLRTAVDPKRDNQIAMITHQAINIKLTPKSMRQLYAAMLKYQLDEHCNNKSDSYAEKELARQLGYDAEKDVATVNSYSVIHIN